MTSKTFTNGVRSLERVSRNRVVRSKHGHAFGRFNRDAFEIFRHGLKLSGGQLFRRIEFVRSQLQMSREEFVNRFALCDTEVMFFIRKVNVFNGVFRSGQLVHMLHKRKPNDWKIFG